MNATGSQSADVKFEIGHVLFIDIVGYSILLINEQSERIQKLKEIVRGTEQFRSAEAEGKLLRLPTGDGGALVFRNNSEAPVICALEISKELKKHPELRVRMGIHSGPVNEVTDLNAQANIAGAGINLAQRVMDCGDAGHILLSRHVAEDLEHYPRWQDFLHELGEADVKHGHRVSVVNLYGEDFGNPEAPQKFRAKDMQVAPAAPGSSAEKARWPRSLIAAVVILAAVAAAVGYYISLRRPVAKAVLEKSIAVLPFENLSDDKSNAYFAEGIQDEILTKLANVADLKVISRTSTQKYKSAPSNLREIAQQLGVANILEGSVQKAGDSVRVNVQLLDAGSDTHLWAETYDRKLIDVFSVESEISQAVAETLRATLTGAEKHTIAQRPTANPEAHDFYLKGRFFWSKRNSADFEKAIAYFKQAIDKDPGYAPAYAALAETYVIIPAFGGGAPREWIPQAQAVAKKALALDDKSAEAHTALAMALCSYDFDLNQARTEFERAIELNPNYATAHMWYGTWCLSSLGRFEEALVEIRRALELDPLSLVCNTDLGSVFIATRRYDLALDQLRKTVELDPNFYYAHELLGEALELNGDLPRAVAEYQKARQLTDDSIIAGLLGHAYAVIGKTEEARQMLGQLAELSGHRYVYAYAFALIHLALGDKEEAISWLEKGYNDRDMYIVSINTDPLLDPIRGDPRFEALVQKVVGPKSGAKQ